LEDWRGASIAAVFGCLGAIAAMYLAFYLCTLLFRKPTRLPGA
jgi:hypothetical protein